MDDNSPESDHARNATDGVSPKSAWPAFASLVLAVVIEVFPTEADTLFVVRQKGTIFLVIAKLCFLTIILAPLLVGIALYGWRAAVVANKWRVLITLGIIMACMLYFIF